MHEPRRQIWGASFALCSYILSDIVWRPQTQQPLAGDFLMSIANLSFVLVCALYFIVYLGGATSSGEAVDMTTLPELKILNFFTGKSFIVYAFCFII